MAASEVGIHAHRANSLASTAEGNVRSRGDVLNHSLAGEGVALPAGEAAEVERLQRSFAAELRPSGDLGRTLVRRMALMSVRMDRCVANEAATLTERIRQAEADFDAEWPEVEGEHDPERDRMRAEAADLALFDPSQHATLARKYEAAAERSFFRALKELRQVEDEAKSANPAPAVVPDCLALGSILPDAAIVAMVEALTADAARKAPASSPKPVAPTPAGSTRPVSIISNSPKTSTVAAFDVPITIGRPA